MNFNQVFMCMVAVGAVIGGGDFLIGNRFGFGQKFKDGFDCIASMAMNMTGIIVIAPVLAKILQPVVFPVCSLIHIDPSILGALFSTNLGGYSLAEGLAIDHTMALFFGLVISSMLGATITYIMPLGFGLIDKEDKEFFIKGLSLGMIPIPAGGLAGGLMMGLPLPVVLQNLIPICIIDIFFDPGALKISGRNDPCIFCICRVDPNYCSCRTDHRRCGILFEQESHRRNKADRGSNLESLQYRPDADGMSAADGTDLSSVP